MDELRDCWTGIVSVSESVSSGWDRRSMEGCLAGVMDMSMLLTDLLLRSGVKKRWRKVRGDGLLIGFPLFTELDDAIKLQTLRSGSRMTLFLLAATREAVDS